MNILDQANVEQHLLKEFKRMMLKKHKLIKKEKEFQLKDIQFKSNKTLKKLTESQSYLNEDELNLKLELEETIGKLFQIYDEIKQLKIYY